MWPGTVRVGLLRLDVAVPGARSLKDRRRAVVGLRDRLRARFDVSCHEVHDDDRPGTGRLLVTTGGADAAVVSRVLDQVVGVADRAGDLVVQHVEREVMVWPEGAGMAGGVGG